jgi:hypothetical protein
MLLCCLGIVAERKRQENEIADADAVFGGIFEWINAVSQCWKKKRDTKDRV